MLPYESIQKLWKKYPYFLKNENQIQNRKNNDRFLDSAAIKLYVMFVICGWNFMYNVLMKVHWFWIKQQHFHRKRDDAGNNSNWHNKAGPVHVQFSKCSYLSSGQIYCCIAPCLVNVKYSVRSTLDHIFLCISYCHIVMASRSHIAILCYSMLKMYSA